MLSHGAVAVGIAELAIMDLVELAGAGVKQLFMTTPLVETERFKEGLGRLDADLMAARALLEAQITRVWQNPERAAAADLTRVAEQLQTAIWITSACVRVAEGSFELAGSRAVYESSSLQRRVRDLRGCSHIGLSTLDLEGTRAFYEGALGFKPRVADTITIEEGGHLRHMFFDVGGGQPIAFLEPNGVPDVPAKYDAGINRGLGVPAGFYHFAFEAGSAAALAKKRDEVRAKGVETTEIVDHGWARSIYFKDPNGISLEYCCIVGELPDGDEMMHGQFTVPLGALELTDTLTKARSTAHRAKTGV